MRLAAIEFDDADDRCLRRPALDGFHFSADGEPEAWTVQRGPPGPHRAD